MTAKFVGLDILRMVPTNILICIKLTYSSPCKYGYPNSVPGGQKNSLRKKSLSQKCINSLVSHKLSHDRYIVLFFFFGALTGPYNPTLPFGGACVLGVGAF